MRKFSSKNFAKSFLGIRAERDERMRESSEFLLRLDISDIENGMFESIDDLLERTLVYRVVGMFGIAQSEEQKTALVISELDMSLVDADTDEEKVVAAAIFAFVSGYKFAGDIGAIPYNVTVATRIKFGSVVPREDEISVVTMERSDINDYITAVASLSRDAQSVIKEVSIPVGKEISAVPKSYSDMLIIMCGLFMRGIEYKSSKEFLSSSLEETLKDEGSMDDLRSTAKLIFGPGIEMDEATIRNAHRKSWNSYIDFLDELPDFFKEAADSTDQEEEE